MDDFLQTLMTAVSVGSLYALIALGYTMVYGVLKFINFAHSDVVVLGAWFSFTLATWFLPQMGIDPAAAPWWAACGVLFFAMLACGGVGFLIERLAYRPLRRAPRLNVLITAIGVSLLLQNVGQLQFDLGAGLRLPFGTQPQGMPRLVPDVALNDAAVARGVAGEGGSSSTLVLEHPAVLESGRSYRAVVYRDNGAVERARITSSTGTYGAGAVMSLGSSLTRPPDGSVYVIRRLARVPIAMIDVVIVVTAGGLMVLLNLLVYRSKLGMAMRAVSFNTDTAALMGIPVDRVISFTFVLGAMLAAAAGFLYAIKYTTLQQPAHAGWVLLGLKAFVAAVVGGIGNIQGAVLGGFLIAFIEQFGAVYVSSDLRDISVFAVLILVLLVRPTGVLGSPSCEKV